MAIIASSLSLAKKCLLCPLELEGIHMVYERIQPFPDIENFNFPELRALSSVWHEKKDQLEDDGAYKELIKKLQRE